MEIERFLRCPNAKTTVLQYAPVDSGKVSGQSKNVLNMRLFRNFRFVTLSNLLQLHPESQPKYPSLSLL